MCELIRDTTNRNRGVQEELGKEWGLVQDGGKPRDRAVSAQSLSCSLEGDVVTPTRKNKDGGPNRESRARKSGGGNQLT